MTNRIHPGDEDEPEGFSVEETAARLEKLIGTPLDCVVGTTSSYRDNRTQEQHDEAHDLMEEMESVGRGIFGPFEMLLERIWKLEAQIEKIDEAGNKEIEELEARIGKLEGLSEQDIAKASAAKLMANYFGITREEALAKIEAMVKPPVEGEQA